MAKQYLKSGQILFDDEGYPTGGVSIDIKKREETNDSQLRVCRRGHSQFANPNDEHYKIVIGRPGEPLAEGIPINLTQFCIQCFADWIHSTFAFIEPPAEVESAFRMGGLQAARELLEKLGSSAAEPEDPAPVALEDEKGTAHE